MARQIPSTLPLCLVMYLDFINVIIVIDVVLFCDDVYSFLLCDCSEDGIKNEHVLFQPFGPCTCVEVSCMTHLLCNVHVSHYYCSSAVVGQRRSQLLSNLSCC